MGWLVVTTVIVWMVCLSLGLGVLRTRGLVRKLQRLVVVAAVAGLGLLLASVLALVHLFHAFSGETLVARVTTVRRSPDAFELYYTPSSATLGLPPGAVAKAPPETTRRFLLQGDQWSISGGVVKWHPWLTALGLKSYHKPMRLSGQFSRLEQQRSNLPSIYPLEVEADQLWEALYRAQRYLPFVEAVYGSCAYVYAEPGVVQGIYVTPSGYLIKRGK